jgi:hypothetical protein
MKSESLSRATVVLRTHRCWRQDSSVGGRRREGARETEVACGDGDVAAPGSGLARAMVTAPYVKLGLGFWGLWPVPIEEVVRRRWAVARYCSEEAVALPRPQAGAGGAGGGGAVRQRKSPHGEEEKG